MEIATDIKPMQVRLACYLLWGCLTLGFLCQALDAGGLSDKVALNYLIVVALWSYLIVGIGKGRNSARILACGFSLLGLFLAPPSLRELTDAPLQGAVSLAQLTMQLAALVLLFVAPGKSWFATSPSNQSRPAPANTSIELLKAIEAQKRRDAAPPK